MLTDATPITFVATADPDFYTETLGLRLIADEPWAIVVANGDITLRIQKAETVQPAPYTALGWHVPDLDAVMAGLRGRGVEFVRYPFLTQDAAGVWTTPDGDRIAWFRDPDGHTLSLTEWAALA
jgi:catechol 2,3-dioxygenase-like lactoylglutathione lyase family enzyme